MKEKKKKIQRKKENVASVCIVQKILQFLNICLKHIFGDLILFVGNFFYKINGVR